MTFNFKSETDGDDEMDGFASMFVGRNRKTAQRLRYCMIDDVADAITRK